MVTGMALAQNTAPQAIPLQDSARTVPANRFNSTPTPMPKTGNPADDTLIRDQRVPVSKNRDSLSMPQDKSGSNVKNGRRKGGSGELDTTATSKRKN